MISFVSLSIPAKADASATRGDETFSCTNNSHVGAVGAVGAVDDVVEDWEDLCTGPIIPIGCTVPIAITTPTVVASSKVEKPAKKISAKGLSTQELVIRVVSHFVKDFVHFRNLGVDFSDGTEFNLYDSDMKDPKYGFLGMAMMKAETYYSRTFGTKVSLSKIRSDIDTLQSQLRVMIAEKNLAGQQKWCVKLESRRADLKEAIENIELSRKKKSPLDDVRAAIAILRRENDNSYRFCDMFTLYHTTGSFEKKVEPIFVAAPIFVVVTKKASPVQSVRKAAANTFQSYGPVTGTDSWWYDESESTPTPAPASESAHSTASESAPVPVVKPAAKPAPVLAPKPVVVVPVKKSIFAQKKLKL
jgi:hypothetical protein